MRRILEPELMEDEEQVQAYTRADFSDSNSAFVDRLLSALPGKVYTCLDLGCGPAPLDVLLCHRLPGVRITAVDGSAAMVGQARRLIAGEGCEKQISVLQDLIPGLDLPDHRFDVVFSKDVLHHLADPAPLWNEALRLLRPGGCLVVADLVRPASRQAAHALVERYAAAEAPLLQEDFLNSLLAAFTMEEVREQVRAAGLPFSVEPLGTRHFIVCGLVQ